MVTLIIPFEVIGTPSLLKVKVFPPLPPAGIAQVPSLRKKVAVDVPSSMLLRFNFELSELSAIINLSPLVTVVSEVIAPVFEIEPCV